MIRPASAARWRTNRRSARRPALSLRRFVLTRWSATTRVAGVTGAAGAVIALLQPDPRIRDAVGQVGQEVPDQHHDPDDHRIRLEDRVVLAVDRRQCRACPSPAT